MHDPEARLVWSGWNVQFSVCFKDAAVDCCTRTFAWRTCQFGVVFQCVECVGGAICGSGRLQFRKHNDVNFKLQPCGDGLKPFTAVNVPVSVCEAAHAPVVEGDT